MSRDLGRGSAAQLGPGSKAGYSCTSSVGEACMGRCPEVGLRTRPRHSPCLQKGGKGQGGVGLGWKKRNMFRFQDCITQQASHLGSS